MKPTNIFTANYMALPGLKYGVSFFDIKHPAAIINAVCDVLDVKRHLLSRRTRKRYIVEARQIAMYLVKKHTKKNLTEIGKMFGGRDHTTAIHSIDKVEDRCFSDEQYKQRLLQIENLL